MPLKKKTVDERKAIYFRFTKRNTLIRLFKKMCKKHRFDISTHTISNVINKKGKKHQTLHLTGKIEKKIIPNKGTFAAYYI